MKIKCADCGIELEVSERSQRKVCDKCRKERMRKTQLEWEKKKKEEQKRKEDQKKALSNLLKEISEYNKKNGVNLTYGQYIALTNK